MIRTMIMDVIRERSGLQRRRLHRRSRAGLRPAMGMLFIMTSAPKVQHRQAPTRDKADSSIRAYLDRRRRTHDANDVIYAFDASRDYDPSPNLEKITAHGAGDQLGRRFRESAGARHRWSSSCRA